RQILYTQRRDTVRRTIRIDLRIETGVLRDDEQVLSRKRHIKVSERFADISHSIAQRKVSHLEVVALLQKTGRWRSRVGRRLLDRGVKERRTYIPRRKVTQPECCGEIGRAPCRERVEMPEAE